MDKKILVGDYIIGDKEKSIIMEILESGKLSEHKKVAEFEKKFAEIIGTKFCTLVNSGTSALIAGLTALIYDERYPKIKKGAKVITSPITYIATSNAIKLVGLEPVFVDVNLNTFDIIANEVETILSKENSDEYCLILPVHLMGYPCDMDKINEIAQKYDLVVFEDTAQAHGSKYKGKNTGTLSLLADYSFYIAHNIQVGEMGAVVTDDEKINKLIKKIKANGRECDCNVCNRAKGLCPLKSRKNDPRFSHDMIGYNFKTMEFQAGLGLIQLENFNKIIKSRQKNVKYFNEKLKKHEKYFILPKYSDDISYLGYPIILKENCGFTREYFTKKLEEIGLETRPLFRCIPTQQPAYKKYKRLYDGELKNANYLGENAFYIGCHQYLKKSDLDRVVQIFNNILSEEV